MENDLTGSGLELKCLAGILAFPTLSSFLAAPVAEWPRPKAAAEAASVSGWQLLAALHASFAHWRNSPISVAICKIIRGHQGRDVYTV